MVPRSTWCQIDPYDVKPDAGRPLIFVSCDHCGQRNSRSSLSVKVVVITLIIYTLYFTDTDVKNLHKSSIDFNF